MAYDAARGKVVLFGGGGSGVHRNDTWEYDGTAWVQISTSTFPPELEQHAMAYDVARGKVVMFGGWNFGSHELSDTWEYDGTDWVQLSPSTSPAARNKHALAYDAARGKIVMFGGQVDGGGELNDTWLFGYDDAWPDEVCINGLDGDGDGLSWCADPDCEWAPSCLACGDASCDGAEWCGACPADCGTCAGCSAADIRLSEVYGGSPAYVELKNTGSCVWDAAGVTVLFRLGCDQATQAFTFPPGSVVPPGGVFRAVGLLEAAMANEVSTGAIMCDTANGAGWVMLCDGFCDLSGCGNVLDYFEKQGGAGPVSPPACASFSPAPLDVSGAGAGDSATRTGFGGGGATGLQSDWSVSPFSRD